MTSLRLRSLIAQGETIPVEFKSEASKSLSDRALVEAVACLANGSDGGTGRLLVGVEDDGRITGARPRHGGETDSNRLAAYLRQRRFEPMQQEQMILQCVEKHGRITRREAAELCRSNGSQACRLLNCLKEQGLLSREGERGRGVGYTRGQE